jgi:hypothetical protein
MNDKQNLNELAQLAEIFAEAAQDRIAADETLMERLDGILGAADTNRLFALEMEIVAEIAAADMEALLGGIEPGKEQEFIDASNERVSPKIIALAELYARVVAHEDGLTRTAAMMPSEARSADISGRFAAAGAPTLSKLAGFRPSPPAFGFVKKPRP